MNERPQPAWRDVALFAGGTAAGLLAWRLLARLGPPSARPDTAEADVVATLAAGHREVLDLLERMEATGACELGKRLGLQRTANLALTRHALAEEDAVMPLLGERADRIAALQRLAREHAEMKIALAQLEELAADDVAWRERVRSLRALVEQHAHDEEHAGLPALRRERAAVG